jgi:hypothetical protein
VLKKTHHTLANAVSKTIQFTFCVCNGDDTVNFALANDAEKTAKYMAQISNVNDQTLLAKL